MLATLQLSHHHLLSDNYLTMLPILAMTFKFEADLSDVLTLFTIALTAYFSIRARMDGSAAERKATTQRMLDRWNSDRMSKFRSIADAVRKERKSFNSDKLFIGSLMQQMPKSEQYKAISELGHFFADLNSLWTEDALDDKLACALFDRPIKVWLPFLIAVDSRKSKDDISESAAVANDWRRTYIFPLHGRLRAAAKRCNFRSPSLDIKSLDKRMD